MVAEHPLVAPGESSVLDEHYGGPRPDTPARKVTAETAAEKAFCALGPVAEAFMRRAAAAGQHPARPRAGRARRAAAAHGRDALLAALARAVAFGRWRASGVRSILAAGTGVAQPTGRRRAGDRPARDRVRSLAHYRLDDLSGGAS